MQWRQIENAQAWDTALTTLPIAHVLQSWAWGEFKARWGWSAQRWLLADGDVAHAAVQLLKRQSGPFSVLYAPKGPTACSPVAYWQTLEHIQGLAQQQRALWLKIDGDAHLAGALSLDEMRQRLTQLGWRYSAAQVQFRNTCLSPVNLSDELLLAGMKQKWRYNVRLADKRGVTIREGSAADDSLLYAMYAETGQRDGFIIREQTYYADAWRSLNAVRLIAEVDGNALAGVVLFKLGTRAYYFYGMSRSEGREHMPSYALQWAALRWARAQDCTVYDWWGAPEQRDSETDSMAGVWRFKQGFGAQFAEGLGAWDFAPLPVLYRLYADVMPRMLGLLRRTRSGLATPI